MDQTIKSIMEHYTKHLKLDKSLCKQLDDYVKIFINLNEDHVKFFGGNLTGVNFIRFTTSERLRLTEDILEIEEDEIRKQVRALPHIGDTWVRGTDGLNLSLLYLVHLLSENKSLSQKDRYDAQCNALFILQCKFLSSMMAEYFKYPVSEPIALAAYQSLSGKFSIKKYGSWLELLNNRCKAILITERTHQDTIKNFSPDDKIQYMVTDIQGRLKQMILNIYDVTVQVKEKNQSLSAHSDTVELDGDIVLKDLGNIQTDYLHYMRSISDNQREFIKEDLVEIIQNSITTLPKKIFVESLVTFSKNIAIKNSPANQLLEEIIFYIFTYFSENKDVVSNIHDYSRVLKNLKDLYTAGKSNNPSVLKARTLADRVNKPILKTSNAVTVAAVRTGLIMYIILRTLTKNHYS